MFGDESAATTEQVLGEAPPGDLMLEAEPLPTAAPFDGGIEYGAERVAPARPVNWISGPYLRGGVNFVLGEDIFDVEQRTGYGISGGFRQPLGPEIGGDRFFFDLGGSFQDSYGKATPVVIDGRRTTTITVTNPPPNPPTITTDVDPELNAFTTTLEEVRRGSAHAALGWFWGPGIDNRALDTQLRFATRIGGRVGHARGGFTEDRLVIPPADVVVGNIRTHVEIDPVFYKQTDTYGGLFVGTEAILLQRRYDFGHIQWTIDGEFANDWIDIGGVWKGSLGTASVMMGFMFSR